MTPTLPAWLTLVDHGAGLTATQTFTVTVARIEYSIYLPLVVRNVP